MRRNALIVGVAGLVSHLWLLHPIVQNGDAVVYNEQIQNVDLGIRTTHIGYMAFGALLQTLSPLNVDMTMNLAALVWASVGAVAAYLLTLQMSGAKNWSLVAAPFMFALGAYLRGGVMAEVDVPSTVLVLWSVTLALAGRSNLAGVCFGGAMLMTPVVATCLPMPLGALAAACVIERDVDQAEGARKSWWRRWSFSLLMFGLLALAVYLPVLGSVWQNYIYEPRGLLLAGRNPYDLAVQFERSATFVLQHARAWLPLGLAALFVGIGQPTMRGLSLGVLAAFVATAAAADRFIDVPVQLPQVCVLACFAVSLTMRLEPRARAGVLVSAFLLTAVPTYRGVHAEVSKLSNDRDDYVAMTQATPKLLVVGFTDPWDHILRFEHEAYGKTGQGVAHTWKGLLTQQKATRSKSQDHTIWLVSRAPNHAYSGFAETHRRDTRVVNGRRYEVWLPKPRSAP